jgi:hypothetical protein
MWDDEISSNFNNLIKRPACSGKEKSALARGEGGKIGGIRLELGIAGWKKTRFMHCTVFCF